MKTSYFIQIAWIWHKNGSEMCLNRPLWEVDTLCDGLKVAGIEMSVLVQTTGSPSLLVTT
jgi:hypothetical protein